MKSVIVESASVQAGGRVLEFRRRLNAPPQAVWAALTEPEKLRQWYALTDDYPTVGQKAKFLFENSNTTVEVTYTRTKRPSVLEYTWDSQTPEQSPVSLAGSVVRFELEAHEEGSVLTLDHILQSDEVSVPDVLGGWDIHLDELADRLHRGFSDKTNTLSANFLADCNRQSAAFARALAMERG